MRISWKSIFILTPRIGESPYFRVPYAAIGSSRMAWEGRASATSFLSPKRR